jgi:hypothetical protein
MEGPLAVIRESRRDKLGRHWVLCGAPGDLGGTGQSEHRPEWQHRANKPVIACREQTGDFGGQEVGQKITFFENRKARTH